jgi:hypothetical protein
MEGLDHTERKKEDVIEHGPDKMKKETKEMNREEEHTFPASLVEDQLRLSPILQT